MTKIEVEKEKQHNLGPFWGSAKTPEMMSDYQKFRFITVCRWLGLITSNIDIVRYLEIVNGKSIQKQKLGVVVV